MKYQIAQRNETTRKKWQSMLHVVGWHEKIGWHQTLRKCIVGVAFIFTCKISTKMKLNVRNSRFKCFQRLSIVTSEERIVKICQNLFFYLVCSQEYRRMIKGLYRSSPVFFFFGSKIRQSATKKQTLPTKTPKGRFWENPQISPAFEYLFFGNRQL